MSWSLCGVSLYSMLLIYGFSLLILELIPVTSLVISLLLTISRSTLLFSDLFTSSDVFSVSVIELSYMELSYIGVSEPILNVYTMFIVSPMPFSLISSGASLFLLVYNFSIRPGLCDESSII